MALHHFHNDLVPFPTPWRNCNVYHNNLHLGGGGEGSLYHPLSLPSRHRLLSRPDNFKEAKAFRNLYDKSLADHAGDLGWSLDYATAWLYRFLVTNRTEVAECIDCIRELGEENLVMRDTPFLIFNYLDVACFGSKLKNMVYLRWKSLPGNLVGRTSAPGIIGSRITIELNCIPFDLDDGGNDDEEDRIDELLEALIHQMIHAWFLVACGAQKKGDEPDGRMTDGLHFGVILRTIADISNHCEEGPLRLTFHAHKRRELYRNVGGLELPPGLWDAHLNGGNPFIALSPHNHAIGPFPSDGQTHCMHDNRGVGRAHIKNWQVECYSKFLDLDMSAKGETIFDILEDGKFKEFSRLEAPPSATYAELIWDEKHIMVNREKVLKFESIEWPLKKHGRYELEIPTTCDRETLMCVYDFIQKGEYPGGGDVIVTDPLLDREHLAPRARAGPPILRGFPLKSDLMIPPPPPPRQQQRPQVPEIAIDAMKHVRVFKVAEKIKFEELLAHALAKLWGVVNLADHPMSVLDELYEFHATKNVGPIHPELHRWSREFLMRRDEGDLLGRQWLFGGAGMGMGGMEGGMKNLKKLRMWYPKRFERLYFKSEAFREDVDMARGYRSKREALQALMGGDGSLQALLGAGAPRVLTAGVQDWIHQSVVDNVQIGGVGGGEGGGGGGGIHQVSGTRHEGEERLTEEQFLGQEIGGMGGIGNLGVNSGIGVFL